MKCANHSKRRSFVFCRFSYRRICHKHWRHIRVHLLGCTNSPRLSNFRKSQYIYRKTLLTGIPLMFWMKYVHTVGNEFEFSRQRTIIYESFNARVWKVNDRYKHEYIFTCRYLCNTCCGVFVPLFYTNTLNINCLFIDDSESQERHCCSRCLKCQSFCFLRSAAHWRCLHTYTFIPRTWCIEQLWKDYRQLPPGRRKLATTLTRKNSSNLFK